MKTLNLNVFDVTDTNTLETLGLGSRHDFLSALLLLSCSCLCMLMYSTVLITNVCWSFIAHTTMDFNECTLAVSIVAYLSERIDLLLMIPCYVF